MRIKQDYSAPKILEIFNVRECNYIFTHVYILIESRLPQIRKDKDWVFANILLSDVYIQRAIEVIRLS